MTKEAGKEKDASTEKKARMPLIPAGVPSYIVLLTLPELLFTTFLPVMAVAGLAIYDSEWLGITLMMGWVLVLLHVILRVPRSIPRPGTRLQDALLTLLPVLIILTNTLLTHGSAWIFFLDQVMLESVTLIGAFGLMLLFGRGIGGDTAWEGLGAGIIILNLIIFTAACYGFTRAWIDTHQVMDPVSYVSFSLAFVTGLAGEVKYLRSIASGEVAINDVLSHYPIPIIAVFVLYFALPIVLAIIY